GIVISQDVSGIGVLLSITVTLTGGTFTAPETISGPHGSATDQTVTAAALSVQILQNDSGVAAPFINETVVGPSGSATISGTTVTSPWAVSVWDQEIMNSFQGWPSSVFVDQNRLGFCNFPALSGAIAWSSIGVVTDLYVGADPSDAFLEL